MRQPVAGRIPRMVVGKGAANGWMARWILPLGGLEDRDEGGKRSEPRRDTGRGKRRWTRPTSSSRGPGSFLADFEIESDDIKFSEGGDGLQGSGALRFSVVEGSMYLYIGKY